MRDEMKRTMFELFGVGSEDDKVLAAGGKKPAVKPEPVKTAPVQAPVQPVVKAKAASYLAAGTSLEGTLRSDGDVEIAGAFKGEVIHSWPTASGPTSASAPPFVTPAWWWSTAATPT